MAELHAVYLHIYDVLVQENDTLCTAIQHINRLGRDTTLGGVFHGAVEVHGVEWSFGYCPDGSGVYRCLPRENPLYRYRETIALGHTRLTKDSIEDLLDRLHEEWPGTSYDILARNCCHFCEELCEELGSGRPPAWLNRMAGGIAAALSTYQAAATGMRSLAGGVTNSFKWLSGTLAVADVDVKRQDARTQLSGSGRLTLASLQSLSGTLTVPASSDGHLVSSASAPSALDELITEEQSDKVQLKEANEYGFD